MSKQSRSKGRINLGLADRRIMLLAGAASDIIFNCTIRIYRPARDENAVEMAVLHLRFAL